MKFIGKGVPIENVNSTSPAGPALLTVKDILDNPAAVDIISLVQTLLEEAAAFRASDIHIEPAENIARVRLRIDGLLSEKYSFPKAILPEIISRLKVLSGLRTDEHQAAQDFGQVRRLVGAAGPGSQERYPGHGQENPARHNLLLRCRPNFCVVDFDLRQYHLDCRDRRSRPTFCSAHSTHHGICNRGNPAIRAIARRFQGPVEGLFSNNGRRHSPGGGNSRTRIPFSNPGSLRARAQLFHPSH